MSKPDTAKIPPFTVSFFVVYPTVALGCAVAVVASPEPRSWTFFATVVATWIGLRGAAWFMYKNRDDVVKLEKFTHVISTVASLGPLVGSASLEAEEQPTTGSTGTRSQHLQNEYTYVQLYKHVQELMRPSPLTVQVQHASVVSLGILLAIRIFHINVFDSHPANIDFGPHGRASNTAFVHEFDSFINFTQGALAAFLSFPAVVGLIARVFTTAAGDSLLLKKPNVYIVWLCEMISGCLTIFPSALTVAAIVDYGYFANSTHLRKMAEWIVGYSCGITAGIYFSSIVSRVLLLISGILNALDALESFESHNFNAEAHIKYILEKLEIREKYEEVNTEENSVEVKETEEKETEEMIIEDKIIKEEKTEEKKYGFGKSENYKGQVIGIFEILSLVLTISCQVLLGVTAILNAVFLGSTWYYDREVRCSAAMICINLSAVAAVFIVIVFAANRIY